MPADAIPVRPASPLRRLGGRLSAAWRLHRPVALVVGASPRALLHALGLAARPSTDRLHLRDLFAEGRRYYVRADAGGFRLTSDSRPRWGSRRQRTGRTALVTGTVRGDEDGGVTLVHLRARMFALHTLRALLIPMGMGLIIVSVTWWPLPARVLLIVAIAVFSWVAHWANAALQAAIMVAFVEKALEHLPPHTPTLETGPAADVVMPGGFSAAWERFYQQHQGEA